MIGGGPATADSGSGPFPRRRRIHTPRATRMMARPTAAVTRFVGNGASFLGGVWTTPGACVRAGGMSAPDRVASSTGAHRRPLAIAAATPCDAVALGRRVWTIRGALPATAPGEPGEALQADFPTPRGITPVRLRMIWLTKGGSVDTGATWGSSCRLAGPTGCARGAATVGSAG